MGQTTHVAVLETIMLMHTERRRSGTGWGRRPAQTQKPRIRPMTSESYNRRRTDRGFVAARTRSTLQALRSMLGLLPVSESLQALQHWRRSAAKSGS
jgi:hypothetical protein